MRFHSPAPILMSPTDHIIRRRALRRLDDDHRPGLLTEELLEFVYLYPGCTSTELAHHIWRVFREHGQTSTISSSLNKLWKAKLINRRTGLRMLLKDHGLSYRKFRRSYLEEHPNFNKRAFQYMHCAWRWYPLRSYVSPTDPVAS